MARYSKEIIDSIANEVIFHKKEITFEQMKQCGWDEEYRCKAYVLERWGCDVGKRGITIRTKKLWDACKELRFVPSDEVIENSIWAIHWRMESAWEAGEIDKRLFTSPVRCSIQLENPTAIEFLGYVLAADIEQAYNIAPVALGTRACNRNFLKAERVGIGNQAEVNSMNREYKEKLKKKISALKTSILSKLWEIETLSNQEFFLDPNVEFQGIDEGLIEEITKSLKKLERNGISL